MKKILTLTLALIFLSFSISACQSNWQIEVTKNGESMGQFNYEDFVFYLEKLDEGTGTIPLGQMLYINGFTLIEEITLRDKEGNDFTFVWDDIALETSLTEAGKVNIASEEYSPINIDVKESPLASEIQYTITDIGPTMAAALGLPDLPQSSGKALKETNAEFGVLILMDGYQFEKMSDLIESGELSFLSSIQEYIHRGLTVYPPVTVAATAALLTGAPPQVNGVYGHGFRSTELTTLFDIAVQEGKLVVAVEGNSLPFNLRNAETSISSDLNGDGYSDDNVMTNALDVIHAGMPDLLYIHFHEVDDMGHTYGPESEEYQAAAVRVDNYLSQIYEALPLNTFIIIFADHGMHAEGEGGNHGNLVASDLIIPIIFLEK
jgi:hypothetical protein